MDNLIIKIERISKPTLITVRSLCSINTSVKLHKTLLKVSTKLIKENIKVQYGLLCSINKYTPPIEPIKLDYPGITNIFSTYENIFIS